jgi:hypothetical protein
MVGTLGEDGLRVDAEIISGRNELAEFLAANKSGSRISYGAFPARENEASRSVTLVLPDADGMVRPHPH